MAPGQIRTSSWAIGERRMGRGKFRRAAFSPHQLTRHAILWPRPGGDRKELGSDGRLLWTEGPERERSRPGARMSSL